MRARTDVINAFLIGREAENERLAIASLPWRLQDVTKRILTHDFFLPQISATIGTSYDKLYVNVLFVWPISRNDKDVGAHRMNRKWREFNSSHNGASFLSSVNRTLPIVCLFGKRIIDGARAVCIEIHHVSKIEQNFNSKFHCIEAPQLEWVLAETYAHDTRESFIRFITCNFRDAFDLWKEISSQNRLRSLIVQIKRNKSALSRAICSLSST